MFEVGVNVDAGGSVEDAVNVGARGIVEGAVSTVADEGVTTEDAGDMLGTEDEMEGAVVGVATEEA